MGLDLTSHSLRYYYNSNLNKKIEALKNNYDTNNPEESNILNQKIEEINNTYQEDCGLWYKFRISYNNNPLYNNVLRKYKNQIFPYLQTHKCYNENGELQDYDYPFPVLSTEGIKKLLLFTKQEYEIYKNNSQQNKDSLNPQLSQNFEDELNYFNSFIEYLQWNADKEEDLDWDG